MKQRVNARVEGVVVDILLCFDDTQCYHRSLHSSSFGGSLCLQAYGYCSLSIRPGLAQVMFRGHDGEHMG